MFFGRSVITFSFFLFFWPLRDNRGGKSYNYEDGEVRILNGQVKQIISCYERHIGVHVCDTVFFDKNGNQTENITGNPWDRYREKYIYVYDHLQRITQITTIPAKCKAIFKYRSDGYSIREIYNPTDPSSDSDLFIYNSDGYLTEEDRRFDIIRYKYNYKLQLIKIERHSLKGKLELRETIKYKLLDSHNNWLRLETLSEGYFRDPTDMKEHKNRQVHKDVQVHETSREIIYY